MSRKPVHLAASGKAINNREVIWPEIRRLRKFRMIDLCLKGISQSSVRDYLLGLEKGGYLRCERTGSGRENRYTLLKDCGVEAPRVRKDGTHVTQGSCREQMWQTMKILKRFTIKELAVNASTEAHPISEPDAKEYLYHLALAGYLKATPIKHSNLVRYQFDPAHDTGPRPPMVQRIKQVFDPNVGRVMYRPPAEGGKS